MNGYQNPNYKSWDEWAKAAGVYDQLSAQQLALAEADPDYGWGTVSNKVGYASASTPEQKAMYHAQQTELNRTKGFTGGTDGSLYDVTPTQIAQNAARDAYTGYGDFSWDREPDYQAALSRVTNPDPFSYDYKSDPNYQAYAKQYTREGRRASEDTMGQYAAMTGGRPSTAAVTASQQAGNYYASQLADKIPELYQQAYQRYLNEFSQRLQGLNALQQDYTRQYGAYNDKYNRLGDAYNVAAGENATSRAAVQDAEQTAYQRRLAADETAYSREQEAWERQWKDAQLRAQYGDYSGLRALGIDVDAWLASQQQRAGGNGPSAETPTEERSEQKTYNPIPSSESPNYLAYLNDYVNHPWSNRGQQIKTLAENGVSADDILLSKQLENDMPAWPSGTKSAPASAPPSATPAVSPTESASTGITNRVDDGGSRVNVDGTWYTWEELSRAIMDDVVKATKDSRTGKYTYTLVNKSGKKGGSGSRGANLQD